MTGDKIDHPFQPGVEVAVSYSRPGVGEGRWTRGKVAKVYKTGRFILEGSGDQQHRACAPSTVSFGDKEWKGQSTATGYDGSSVYLLTPKYVEKIVQDLRIRQGRAAIATLNAITGKLAPDFFTAEVVADLQRLAAIAKGGAQ